MISLAVQKREKTDTIASLINKGRIPAVFYGRKEPSTTISVSLIDFKKAWKQAGESSIIVLKGDGVDDVEALIHDVDVHPVTSVPRHADFYAIEKGKKVRVELPIEFVGVSNAIKSLGGTLVKVLHSLEIEAFPKDLPHSCTVDISALETIGSTISAKDISLPTGVTLLTKGDDIVVSVSEPMKELVEDVVVDLSQIEVEKKGKQEEAPVADAEAPASDKPAK